MKTDLELITIEHPLGDCSLQSIQDDVNTAHKNYTHNDFCFNYTIYLKLYIMYSNPSSGTLSINTYF